MAKMIANIAIFPKTYIRKYYRDILIVQCNDRKVSTTYPKNSQVDFSADYAEDLGPARGRDARKVRLAEVATLRSWSTWEV